MFYVALEITEHSSLSFNRVRWCDSLSKIYGFSILTFQAFSFLIEPKFDRKIQCFY